MFCIILMVLVMFVVSVFFCFLIKLKNKVLILLVSIFVYLLNIYVDMPTYYNIDSACSYQLYYVIGYLVFDKLNTLLTSENVVYRSIKVGSGVVSMMYTALLFFKHNVYTVLGKAFFVEKLCSCPYSTYDNLVFHDCFIYA